MKISEIIKNICSELDQYMKDLDDVINSGNVISDKELEDYILRLPSIIYFIIDKLEETNLKASILKVEKDYEIKSAKYHATGKVIDREYQAAKETKESCLEYETVKHITQIVQAKIDAAESMLNSLKKVMTRRMNELELSNGKFMGRTIGGN